MKIKIRLFIIIITSSIVFTFYGVIYPYGIGVSATAGAGGYAAGLKHAGDYYLGYFTGYHFVFDTVTAGNDRLGYRMHLGYENAATDKIKMFHQRSIHRVTLENIFGFKIYYSRHVRFWMGPLIAFSFQFQKYTDHEYIPYGMLGADFYNVSKILKMMGILSFGGVAGVNINMGDLVTLGFEMGLQISMGAGTQRKDRTSIANNSGTLIPNWTGTGRFTSAIELGKVEAFARICILFRIHDIYEPEQYEKVDMILKR